MKGFKKCSNGHFYKEGLAQCPYCSGQGASSGGNSGATVTISGNSAKTPPSNNAATKTVMADGYKPTKRQGDDEEKVTMSPNAKVNVPTSGTRTVFGDDVEVITSSGNIEVIKEIRTGRRLVGWLVTYSIDPMGIDFKIYEGKNLIGRDMECNITLDDKTISGKHATILFRADKYRIKDEFSSHGTFVNGVDIVDANFELADGDIIKMGETMLKFKSSL